MGRKKTHEEFLEEFNFIYKGEYNVLSRYQGAKKHVTVIHNICNNEYPATPNNLLSNDHNCLFCSVKNRTKTTKEFIEEVYNLVGDEYTVLGEYIQSHIGIKIRHNTCNLTWEPSPTSFLSEKRCPKCFGNMKKSHDEFVKEVYLINRNIKILGKYSSSKNTIECQCLIDGHVWYPYPSVLLNDGGCPKCAGNAKKSHEEFIEELNQINPNILVLGEYKNIDTKIKCKCIIDNHIWYPSPYTLLKSIGCPVCSQSKGEKECKIVFDLRNVYYIPQKEFEGLIGLGGGLLSYDFYLPKYNLLVEYQGEYHDKVILYYKNEPLELAEARLEKQKEHDRRKREYAKTNKIKLLEIWYRDFDNIEDILKRKLNLT